MTGYPPEGHVVLQRTQALVKPDGGGCIPPPTGMRAILQLYCTAKETHALLLGSSALWEAYHSASVLRVEQHDVSLMFSI